MLVGGMLFVYVMPEGERMNRWWYQWVVTTKFPSWIARGLGNGVHAFLVQDHERALWAQEPRVAMREQGITLVDNYPKRSQDMNPIETAWREVRARLADTKPVTMEHRDVFVARLRLAIAWVNRNRKEYFTELCTSQKAWARDVLDAKPQGGARSIDVGGESARTQGSAAPSTLLSAWRQEP